MTDKRGLPGGNRVTVRSRGHVERKHDRRVEVVRAWAVSELVKAGLVSGRIPRSNEQARQTPRAVRRR